MFLKICVFFLNSRFLFIHLQLDRPKLFQMIVSDEFQKQCETEAFLKFNSCFSTEFARLKNTCLRKTAVTLPRCIQMYKMIHQTKLTDILDPNKLKNCELKQ